MYKSGKIWEISSHYLKMLLQPCCFLLSFWDSNDINVRSFVMVTRFLRHSSFVFSLFSLCCSDCVISILSSSLLFIFSVLFILLLSLSTEIFSVFVTVFFSCKISFGSWQKEKSGKQLHSQCHQKE